MSGHDRMLALARVVCDGDVPRASEFLAGLALGITLAGDYPHIAQAVQTTCAAHGTGPCTGETALWAHTLAHALAPTEGSR
jgi:hypothetical protein